MIFEGCLDSNPEYCRSKLARYRLSHPSLLLSHPSLLLSTHPSYLATHPFYLATHPSYLATHPTHRRIIYRRCRWHRWTFFRRCHWHRQKILGFLVISPWQGLINFSPVSLTPLNSLSLVSLTTAINIHSRISPRIFEKIQNGPNGILGGLGDTDSWKKPGGENLVSDSL